MKKFYAKNFAYGAAALLVGAVGLTGCSSDDELTNVNPTYDGESVKTQFAINIPVAGKQGTRVSQAIVQGQDDPIFRGMSNIKLIPFSADLATSPNFTSDAIVLKDITTATGGEGLDNGAKFYTDISVPVGTNRFLFYSEATRSGDTSDKANGSITAPKDFTDGDLLNGLTSLSNLKFTLTGIYQEANSTTNQKLQGYLAGILGEVTKSLSSQATGNATLELALTNLKNLKVGSSDAILAVMQDLYDIVKTGGSGANSIVESSIKTYFNDNDANGVLSYKTGATGYVTNADNYPGCLGIPDGAAQVEYKTDAFEYTSLNSSDFATYTYPAALYYFVNSTVGASDQTHGDSWNGNSTSDWSTFVSNTNYPNDKVSASTRSIVLKSPIQYAVSQLVYNVKFASTSGELKDNQGINRAIGTENFKLKGILIGGQKGVDYKFEQDADADAKTIYDPLAMETAITTTKSTDFYSLALQTAKRQSQSGNQETVNIALEFVNNGEDFYGKDGIVPAGGTFYLAGTLSTKAVDSNDYVFEQDHKTIANITINSLENAQYTIPDLRKTKLELGLYVDLTWEDGLVYDVTIQ